MTVTIAANPNIPFWRGGRFCDPALPWVMISPPNQTPPAAPRIGTVKGSAKEHCRSRRYYYKDRFEQGLGILSACLFHFVNAQGESCRPGTTTDRSTNYAVESLANTDGNDKVGRIRRSCHGSSAPPTRSPPTLPPHPWHISPRAGLAHGLRLLANILGDLLLTVEFLSPATNLLRRQSLDVAVVKLPRRGLAPAQRRLHGGSRRRRTFKHA